MAVAFVQGTTKTVSGVSSTTLAYGSNVAAGSLLAASVSETSLNVSSITDNLNAGSWNADISINTTGAAADCDLRTRVGTVAGACTVTYNFSVGQNAGINQEEYSGVATTTPLDKTSTNEGVGTTLASTSVTTTTDGQLILSACTAGTASTTLSNATSGWTVRENTSPNATNELQVATGERIQATAGAVTTTWTGSQSNDMAILIATYKAAAAAGGVPQIVYGYGSN